MLKINPFLLTDSYKLTHPEQYPNGVEYVYSNITPRGSRLEGVNEVIVFGLQYFLKEYLIRQFNENFFDRDKEKVIEELTSFLSRYLGEGVTGIKKYEDLYDLGYLPLKIKALPEGTRCPVGVPYCTIVNTDPKFYWLTNFIETLMQNILWNPLTAATIADQYRQLLNNYAEDTCNSNEHVKFQAHNFSMRGMSSLESALTTDAGHLLSFVGSDTVPGIMFVDEYYNANSEENLVSCSVPATEHSVMSAGQKEDERETFRRLICDIYPAGIVSIVSDTWDLWKVLTEIAPSLRGEIEARDGKVVFRPDSGDPIKIVCGYTYKEVAKTFNEATKLLNRFRSSGVADAFYTENCMETEVIKTRDGKYILIEDNIELCESEVRGCVKILDEQFGSTVNDKGFKELNPKVGLIYGDSITMERCEAICEQLKQNGYASNNVVFGVGSFTYQYNTRDTFSIACKATHVVVNGEDYNIFKDPVTDDGTKKSACGLLKVDKVDGAIVLNDQVTREEEEGGMLEVVYEDGELVKDCNFEDIRAKVQR